MFFFIIILFVLSADQLSKYLVVSFLDLGQSVPILDRFFSITYVLNPGAALGLFAYKTIFFIVITVVVALIILYYYYHLPPYYKFTRIGLALQLGGAAGNLVDRIRVGYVIDFINISFFPPIFNIADIAIVLGGILFIYSLWKEGKKAPLFEGDAERT